MDYDERYAKVDALFGTEPETAPTRFADRLEQHSTVLEIGAGQGRNG